MKYTSIARMMAARRRHLQTVSRTYPNYRPGMSTAEYVIRFGELNKFSVRFNSQGAEILPIDLEKYRHPAAMLSGPEVIAEAV